MILKACSLCLLGTIATLGLQASEPLESYLPEHSSIVAGVSDFKDFKKHCMESPIAELVQNKDVVAVFQKTIDKLKDALDKNLDDDEIEDFEEWSDTIDGQIVIGVDYSKITAAVGDTDASKVRPGVVLLADVREPEDFVSFIIRELQDDTGKGSDASLEEEKAEEYSGIDIHHYKTVAKEIEPDPETQEMIQELKEKGAEVKLDKTYSDTVDFVFGHVKRVFFFTNSLDSAKDIIDAIKGDSNSTFADTDAYQKQQEEKEGYAAYLFVDLKPAATLLEKVILSTAKSPASDADSDESDSKAAEMQQIVDALAMHTSLDFLSLGVKCDRDSVLQKAHIAIDTNTGIGRILKGYTKSYPTPSFVPESAITIASSGFNLGSFLTEAKNLAFNAYPNSSLFYQLYLNQILQATGVNMESDFIDNIGDGYLTFSMEPPTDTLKGKATGNIYAIKIEQPDTFWRALNAIIAMVPAGSTCERRQFMGTEMVLFPNAQGDDEGGMRVSLAVKDGWLLISNFPETLQNALATTENDQSFWASDNFKNFGHGHIAPDGFAIMYGDVSALTRLVLNAAVVANAETGSEELELDPSTIPNIKDLPYCMWGKTTKVDDGFATEYWLIRKD